MFGYIYKTTYIEDGRIYIGKREKSEFDYNYYGSGKHIKSAINKYGKDKFKVEILEWCENKSELLNREIYWIDKLNSRNPQIGFNITKGGEGGKGWLPGEFHHTETTKKLISEKLKGKHSSIKGKIAIYNETEDLVIYIDRLELEYYEELGWIRFNPRAKKSNYIWMIDLDENNTQVNMSEVDYYLNLGYSLGRNYKPCEGIKQSEEWVNSRIIKTKEKLIGKKHINNGIENKVINGDELDYYLGIGWVEGEIKNTKNLGKHSANRIWINNGEKCKFIPKDELVKYQLSGWEPGRLK